MESLEFFIPDSAPASPSPSPSVSVSVVYDAMNPSLSIDFEPLKCISAEEIKYDPVDSSSNTPPSPPKLPLTPNAAAQSPSRPVSQQQQKNPVTVPMINVPAAARFGQREKERLARKQKRAEEMQDAEGVDVVDEDDKDDDMRDMHVDTEPTPPQSTISKIQLHKNLTASNSALRNPSQKLSSSSPQTPTHSATLQRLHLSLSTANAQILSLQTQLSSTTRELTNLRLSSRELLTDATVLEENAALKKEMEVLIDRHARMMTLSNKQRKEAIAKAGEDAVAIGRLGDEIAGLKSSLRDTKAALSIAQTHLSSSPSSNANANPNASSLTLSSSSPPQSHTSHISHLLNQNKALQSRLSFTMLSLTHARADANQAAFQVQTLTSEKEKLTKWLEEKEREVRRLRGECELELQRVKKECEQRVFDVWNEREAKLKQHREKEAGGSSKGEEELALGIEGMEIDSHIPKDAPQPSASHSRSSFSTTTSTTNPPSNNKADSLPPNPDSGDQSTGVFKRAMKEIEEEESSAKATNKDEKTP